MSSLCFFETTPEASRRTLRSYRERDPHFVRDLLESDRHVRGVAERLRAALGPEGPVVEVQELRIRPEEAAMGEYSDDGDLRVGGLRVECKRRNLTFSGPEDFPFGTCIVDVCHTYDKSLETETPVFAYIIDSQDMSGTVCVLGSTAERWTAQRRWDRPKQRHRRFYECGREVLCTFDDLVRVLRGGDPPKIPDPPSCFFTAFADEE